jgi:hypothetical protein
MPTGPLQFYLATILPRDGGASQPTEISVGADERLPYDPPTVFHRIQGTQPGWRWQIGYSDPNSVLVSTLVLDHEGKVIKQDILPWHAAIFQPLLDYAGVALIVRIDVPAPTDTPAPTPASPFVVTIAGKKVTLPPGMSYGEENATVPATDQDPTNFTPRHLRIMSYQVGSSYSQLQIDDDGRTVYIRILPEHMDLFQPLLDAVLPRVSETVTVYGQTITLAPGLHFWEGTRPGTTNPIWTVEYTSIPAQPEISYIAVDKERGNIYRRHINPGDEAIFQPLLELAASVSQ